MPPDFPATSSAPSGPAATTPARPRPPRRFKLWGGIVLLALALLAAGLLLRDRLAAEDPLATLRLAAVTRGDLEDLVTATGSLQPRNFVDVGAQVSGLLKTLHVELGDVVEAGALLAEIDPTLYLARVDASRAQLRGLRAQQRDREAQRELAQLRHAREQALYAEDATSTESLQAAAASLRSASAQLDALRAQIEQTESSLRAEEANLAYARILAPMAGTVVSISARSGQAINAAQQAPILLRIADLSTMTVRSQVSEADVSRLQPGMEAYFTTLGGGAQRWHGELARIEPAPEVQNNVVLYNALFEVPNPEGRLMSQMTAQVFFVVAKAKNALLVPAAALGSGAAAAGRGGSGSGAGAAAGSRPAPDAPRKASVQVLDARGQLVSREVEVGLSNRIQTEILDGLSEGEQVVLGAPAGANPAPGPLRMPRL